MYKLLYPSIRSGQCRLYRLGSGSGLGLVLFLVLRFCPLKLIVVLQCIGQGVPSFELVRLALCEYDIFGYTHGQHCV